MAFYNMTFYNMTFYNILFYLYNLGIIAYKYTLFMYYYLTSHNDIKISKNNKRVNIANIKIQDEDQIIICHKNKKYSLIKKYYNDNIIDIINSLYNLRPEISIKKIILIKDIKYNSKYTFTDDELLDNILMYYGPNNDIYNGQYKIKLKDLRDDQNNEIMIDKISYIDNNFDEVTLFGDDFIR